MDVYQDAMAIRTPNFEIAAAVPVIIDDNLDNALAQIKQQVGFYVGGMGAKVLNVHKEHISRFGLLRQPTRFKISFCPVRDQAIAAVPDELADEISLRGPKDSDQRKARRGKIVQ